MCDRLRPRDSEALNWVFLHGMASVRQGKKSDALAQHAADRGDGFLRYDARGYREWGSFLGLGGVEIHRIVF